MSGLRSAEEVFLPSKGQPSAAGVDSTLLVCSVYEDERPLKNAVGLIDWRLKGHLSQFLQQGWFNGSAGEVTYVPIRFHGKLRHLLLVGLGASDKAKSQPAQTLQNLKSTIQNLGFAAAAFSQSSFPFWSAEEIKSELSGIHVEMTT